MTQKNQKRIDAILVNTNQPTELTFQKLYTWIIWQFPRQKAKGLCGAVHPPIPQYGWVPAIIYTRKQRLSVHAHLEKTFASPEAAVEYLSHCNDL